MVIHMVLLCVLFVQEFPLLVKSEVAFTAERVCSILTDFGTESQAWFTPGFGDANLALAGDANLLFRFSMPLPDADHSLHHVTCPTQKRKQTCGLIICIYIYIYI